ncbi:MAG: acyl carrier protein [Prevotellaceae bacterium]|nr:acyl carrier protein [Candidatus Colivivens caballi]
MSITPAVYDDVKKIIVDCLGVDESQVTYSASFMNDLGADDLDAVELIMRFESYFGISISDEEAERIHSVGDALECIDIALSRKRFMPESKEPESPNNEDNINSPQQILISSMSEGDMEYFNEFYEIINSGEVSERDTRFLAKIRVANGISEQRALELELLAKQQIHLSPKEQEYIDEYKEMVRSGSISDRDR